jgi:hypothetical protein
MTNFYLETLVRLGRVSSDWRLLEMSCRDVPDGYLRMKGAIPTGVYRSGKRKGRCKFPKQLDTHWITDADVESTKFIYEQTTGKCHECEGTGKSWCGWGVDTGHRYKDCPRCNASGVTPKEVRAG